jgi:flagellar hook-length control protein FliK
VDSPLRARTIAEAGTPAHRHGADTSMAQVVPALLTLSKVGSGNKQMTVRLHPADLGTIQVRIQRAASGTARIDISADKPETLQALQRDQDALHRTLDEANIPASGRTVTFHSIQSPPQTTTGAASGHGSGSDAPAGRNNNATSDTGSTSGGRGEKYTAGVRNRRSGERMPGGPIAPVVAADSQTYRIGLNITA